MLILKGLKLDLILSFVAKGSSAIFGVALTVVVSRILGVEEVAQFFWVLSAVNILVVVSMFGIDLLVVREIAHNFEVGNMEKAIATRDAAHSTVLATSLISGVFFFLLFFLVELPVGSNALLFVILLLVPAICSISINGESIRALGLYFAFTVLYGMLAPLIFLLLVGLMNYFFLVSSEEVMILYAVAMIFTAFVAQFSWGIKINIFSFSLPQIKIYKSIIVRAVPFFMSSGVNVIIQFSPVIIMGVFLESEDLSIYYGALRLSLLLSFLLTASNMVFAPKMAAAFARNNLGELSRFSHLTSILGLLTALPFLIIIIFWGTMVMSVFGQEYASGDGALLILAIGQFINASTGGVVMLLMMSQHQKTIAIINLLALAISLVLNFLLIAEIGYIGAAIATSISVAFINLSATVFCYYHLRIVPVYFQPFYWK